MHSPTTPAFLLTVMTADPRYAAAADAAGIDRVGVDLEVKGKADRQLSRPSWIAGHSLDDLRRVAAALRRAALFVRIHPFDQGGRAELEQVIEAGAKAVMLPMFKRADEALDFVRAVDGRAVPVLLLETVGAAADLGALLRSPLDFEVHIGLNDLGISRGHRSPWGMLLDPLLPHIARQVVASGRRLAIGRLARPGDATLPVPADLICALTCSLGATGGFVSQYFPRGIDANDPAVLGAEIAQLRRRLAAWGAASAGEIERAMRELEAAVGRL